MTLSYANCGRLSSVTDSFGHALTFTYDTACGPNEVQSRIKTVTDPAGGVYTYNYSQQGNLLSVTFPNNTTRTYSYGAIGPSGGIDFKRALIGLTDESGAAFASWGYNAGGMATSSSYAGGAEAVSISYYAPNCAGWRCIQSATTTDAAGTSRTYSLITVNGKSVVSAIKQPAANGSGDKISHYTYDVNGNVASYIDFNGRETRRVWDLTRNLEISRTEAYGTPVARTVTTAWNPNHRLPDADYRAESRDELHV